MKSSKIRRVQSFHSSRNNNIFENIIAFLVWGLFAIFTLIVLYMNFVGNSFTQILEWFGSHNPNVPFWFSAVLTIFFFPISLLIILVAAVGRMMR